MLPFTSERDIQHAIPRVLEHLARHKVLAYPTETVYGLGGSIDATSVDALLRCKGRTPDKSFLLLINGLDMLTPLQLQMTASAQYLAEQFWPGPLTLVLPTEASANHTVTPALRGPAGGIAVRWTSHPAVQELLDAYQAPITSTSANRPGEPPAMSAAEVQDSYASSVTNGDVLLLDGGTLTPSRPSTVIDCMGSTPRILRMGAVSYEVLRTVVPDLISLS